MVADELILGISSELDYNRALQSLPSYGVMMDSVGYAEDFIVAKLPTNDTTAFYQKLDAIRKGGLFEYVEPNGLAVLDTSANDTYFVSGHLWGLNQPNDADINAPEAWEVIHHASSIKVGVIDTGMKTDHEDLAGNFSGLQYDFGNGNSIANDIDGQGTHVSGTIGAVGNNGIGVVGVAWSVQLMAGKVRNDSTGTITLAATANAINWCVNNGAHVINVSLGGTQTNNAITNAINNARTNKVVCVFSAGNLGTNNDTNPVWPANYSVFHDNVITVAASTRTDGLAWYSNYGATTVNIAAPGGNNDGIATRNILSTYNNGGYAWSSGTSMAAPHVAGAAALLKARFGDLPASDIIARIENSVDTKSAFTGKMTSGGMKIISGFTALTNIVAGAGYAGSVRHFVAGAINGASDLGYFIVPVTEEADIAHARDLAYAFPNTDFQSVDNPLSLLTIYAEIKPGSDGINRNYEAGGAPLWSWHVSSFRSFTDFTPGIYDGLPRMVEANTEAWMQNTRIQKDDPDAPGHIGFTSVTIKGELPLQWTSIDAEGLKESWFGRFEDSQFPWVHHEIYGWLYVTGFDPFDIWFWSQDKESWFWMTEANANLVFRLDDETWLYCGPDRWAYDFTAGQWIWGVL